MSILKQSKTRILLVDDNQAIHEDFKKILEIQNTDHHFNALESELFGKKDKESHSAHSYVIDSAFQGEDALELVKKSVYDHNPYAVAFVDVRMPPGWDGIVTIKKLWEVDPNIQMVICTAYADYSWKQIVQELENSNNFLILKKPFDVIEIRQLAASLTLKWTLQQEVEHQIDSLESAVAERTRDLDKTLSLTKATLEATTEGILAIGKDHKVISYNKNFLDNWHISETLLQNEKSYTIFQRLSKQVEETNLFLKVMNHLCDKEKREDHIREWTLKNGVTMEIDVHPQYLQNEIIGSVFSFRDISDRKKLEEQLLYQATHDNLTGLPNRVLLMDRIEQAIAHAKRDSMHVGILLIDLDNFKELNDSLGHAAGDILLKKISERLKNNVRDIDTLVRLGGDEFVIVLVSQSREENVLAKSKELIQIFASPCEIENHMISVTASIGISFYPRDGQDPISLLKNADAALYHAKDIGKNMYQVYLSEFNERLLQRAELLAALRQSIEKKELLLHYQPLIHSETHKIMGSEALIRWQHPSLGIVYPQTFIPLAEETGLIIPIGDWVLQEACYQTKKWQETINPNLSIAINISSYQFIQKDFVEKIQKILAETKLDPSCLELEMTESQIFKNIPDTAKKMQQLKALGLRFSIDDFGTGYASFSYLKYFPFDKVKIDKTFIKGIHVNSNDDAIVEAIINMTKKMGIEVLAEGVETKEQIAFLMSHHGNQMQGYYYSPPLDSQKFTELLIIDNSVKQE